MNQDILIIYAFLGIILMFRYAFMVETMDLNSLWTNDGRNIINPQGGLLIFYKVMICISVIAGLYMIYYLTTFCPKNDVLMYTGSIVMLIFSIVWAFRPFLYSKITLAFVFIGAILLMSGVCLLENNEKDKKIVAIVAMSILLIQTGILDFGIWTGLLTS